MLQFMWFCHCCNWLMTVHYLGERAHFSSSFVAIFWWFLPSNAPIMLYNIPYWWYFLCQGNQWTKYLAHLKIQRPKTLPTDGCVFGHFGRLSLAAVHSADCQFDSRVKWWIHVSSIVTYLCKNSFLLHWNSCKQCSELLTRCCFWLTVSKHCTCFEHSFLIEKCSCKNGEYTAFWYLQLLCYFTQLQFTIGQNKYMKFSGVFPENCRIWVTWAFSIICVCMTAFKVSIPPLNSYVWWSRVWITLIKPLLSSNSIFSPSETNTLSAYEMQIFLLFWKFATVASLE